MKSLRRRVGAALLRGVLVRREHRLPRFGRRGGRLALDFHWQWRGELRGKEEFRLRLQIEIKTEYFNVYVPLNMQQCECAIFCKQPHL